MEVMDLKNKLWFSGIWLLPVSGAISACIAYLIFGIRQLKAMMDGTSAALAEKEIILLFLIAVISPVAVLIVNVIRYKIFNERNFAPASSRGSGYSRDKRKAMEGRIPREYLSSKPDGFTIGKKGIRYVRLPVDPKNILHTLVIGSPGSMKSTTLLNSLIYNFNFK